MSDTKREIARLSAQGYCCSQIMVQLGLDAINDDNQQLIDAVRGLCKGLYTGMTCGTLTGAACLLSMLDPKAAEEHMIARLAEWFEMTFSASYGGSGCKTILGDDPMNRFTRCPAIMAETYEKCRELLAEAGHTI